MTLTLDLYGETFPAKWEVCPRCDGTGKHVNPAVDGNGITRDEMDELGPDFFDDYMSGVYDVACEECNGERLILVLDEDLATPDQVSRYEELQEEENNFRAEVLAERRMGA